MTRINCVPPSELHDVHLLAEYRELPRVFGLVKKAAARNERPDDKRNPTEYILGTGHVRFFYSKLLYLSWRQEEIVREMQRRGMKPQHTRALILEHQADIPEEWWGTWTPRMADIRLNRARIEERLAAMHARRAPKAHFQIEKPDVHVG